MLKIASKGRYFNNRCAIINHGAKNTYINLIPTHHYEHYQHRYIRAVKETSPHRLYIV